MKLFPLNLPFLSTTLLFPSRSASTWAFTLYASSSQSAKDVSKMRLPHSHSSFNLQRRCFTSTCRATSLNYGQGMNQDAMMESDMLIAVDLQDNPIPHASISKRTAHEFNPSQPRGIAHRAFSVFLFNSRNELLITQRAPSKITFPNVWTNTCCSHPLLGMTPCEMDDAQDGYPLYPGIRHAANRKLRHELGIDPLEVPHDSFRFLTKFHYWAADTVTYGPDAPWGEHEIDYVLFVKCEQEPTLDVNQEEVSDYRYVSASELKELMAVNNDGSAYCDDDSSPMLWSPWFRGIMDRGGFEWWENMDESLRGGMSSKYCNRNITFFDPSLEHWAKYNLVMHGKETGVLSMDGR